MQGCEEVVQGNWHTNAEGSRMFKFHRKLKQCRAGLLKWRKKKNTYSRIQIENIKRQMGNMQKIEDQRDWNAWAKLRSQLDDTYKDEEEYWSRKSRVEWLQVGDKNTKYFYVVTCQRKRTRIDILEK